MSARRTGGAAATAAAMEAATAAATAGGAAAEEGREVAEGAVAARNFRRETAALGCATLRAL